MIFIIPKERRETPRPHFQRCRWATTMEFASRSQKGPPRVPALVHSRPFTFGGSEFSAALSKTNTGFGFGAGPNVTSYGFGTSPAANPGFGFGAGSQGPPTTIGFRFGGVPQNSPTVNFGLRPLDPIVDSAVPSFGATILATHEPPKEPTVVVVASSRNKPKWLD
jgi:hypothetical protein